MNMKNVKFLKLLKIFIIYFVNVTSLFIYLIPRDKKKIIFIGKNDGLFLDNVKYLFLHKQNEGIEKFFITFNKKEYHKLKDKINIIYFPSWKGLYLLITSNYLIIDNVNWTFNFFGLIYFLLRGSKKIQLWHGCPIKKIEYDNEFDRLIQLCKRKSKLKDKIKWSFSFMRCIKYDLLLISSTNKHIIQIFKRAFKFNDFISIGYPRNEFLLFPDKFYNWRKFINESLYKKLENFKKNKMKIILFLPTFRDDNQIFITLEDLKKLDLFANKNNFIFVIKPHPWDDVLESFLNGNSFENIVSINRFEDIYPYLNLSDLLISDISSIVFDYLLLNKPIIHFFPDKENYLKNSRDLYFKLDNILSGPLVENIDKLMDNLINFLIKRKDNYFLRRKKIKNYIFGNIKHDSELIYKRILNV